MTWTATTMEAIFRNQAQFFALPASEQQAFLPVSMPKTGFDGWEGLLVTEFPLQALTTDFQGYCLYFSRHIVREDIAKNDQQASGRLCGELYDSSKLLLDDWSVPSPCPSWAVSELATCPFWETFRAKVRLVLFLNGWEQVKPEIYFWEMMQQGEDFRNCIESLQRTQITPPAPNNGGARRMQGLGFHCPVPQLLGARGPSGGFLYSL